MADDGHADEWLQAFMATATDEQKRAAFLRGFTDEIGDLVTDGLERDYLSSRYAGGDTFARVLDFGPVSNIDGLRLRITVEMIRDDG